MDEYQDIDEPQYRLVSAIVGRSKKEKGQKEKGQSLNILAVGDDDQTIYGFSGANVRFIRQYREDYGDGEETTHHLVQCYRSSHHIVQAANHLIAHNQDRMKGDHPIRVDHARRHEPPGEPIRIHSVRSVEHQAAAIVEEIRRLHSLAEQAGRPLARVAVLARRHAILEPVYALLQYHLPQTSITWLGRHGMPPLPRIREIHDVLSWLGDHRQEQVSVSQILDQIELPTTDKSTGADRPALVEAPIKTGNRWHRLLREILAEWAEASGDQPVPGTALREFLYEALAEQRREPTHGYGPVLATIHAAKGLEFDHVFVTDGGWSHPRKITDQEEERRLFYVGMTRSKQTLDLFTGIDGTNPHIECFRGRHAFLERSNPEPHIPDRDIWGRRRELLGLEDVFLSWAGRQAPPTHGHIQAVATGDSVWIHPVGGRLAVVDSQGHSIAMLSKHGLERWRPLLPLLESLRVYAWIERRAKDSEPEHRRGLTADRWQVPIIDVTLRPS